jgi:hypothetical protein
MIACGKAAKALPPTCSCCRCIIQRDLLGAAMHKAHPRRHAPHQHHSSPPRNRNPARAVLHHHTLPTYALRLLLFSTSMLSCCPSRPFTSF